MCDYSLLNIPNRLAVEGEELVITVNRYSETASGIRIWSGKFMALL